MEYPCDGCIVFVNCSKLCYKVVRSKDEILSSILEHKRCIDCGGRNCFEYPSIKSGWVYLLCSDCKSVYTMIVAGKIDFNRYAKQPGPIPMVATGAVFNGTPTTFVDFLVRHIGAYMGEGWYGISL